GIYSVEKVKNCIFEQNGQVNEDVLELIHKSEAWLEREVKAAGYNGINDVFLGEYIDGQLRLTGYSK
ncbi:MAG: YetF domain-containing protein, partial [Lactobacillus helveticus]